VRVPISCWGQRSATTHNKRANGTRRNPHTPTPQGFAYVEFESDAGVQAALLMDGTTLRGTPLQVVRSQPPRSAVPPGAHTAFVKGLGSAVGEGELRRLFGGVGCGVGEVRLPRDKHGKAKVRFRGRLLGTGRGLGVWGRG